ncbi:MAG: nitroreductase family protein [Anaerolineae bacterium]|nr:nitroreductase family protein [Anaerolineae bacterium]
MFHNASIFDHSAVEVDAGDDKLQQVLEAARLASTTANRQPVRVIVVTTTSIYNLRDDHFAFFCNLSYTQVDEKGAQSAGSQSSRPRAVGARRAIVARCRSLRRRRPARGRRNRR